MIQSLNKLKKNIYNKMDFQQWINQLVADGVYLRHQTISQNIPSILQNGFRARYVNLNRVINPDDIQLTQALPGVYFQLVQGIRPDKNARKINNISANTIVQVSPYDVDEEESTDLQVELWLSPNILQNKQIIFHPNSWAAGSNMSEMQWSTMVNLSNMSLIDAYNQTVYRHRFGDSQANEVIVIGDISVDEFNQHINVV